MNAVNTSKGTNHGTVRWQSPSNIALIKYWGKKGFQIPANPSLSMTLSRAVTNTSVTYTMTDNPGFEFFFEGRSNLAFAAKINKYFATLEEEFPLLRQFDLKIQSSNTFPHSAGIASSASAMSALALCLCDIKEQVTGHQSEREAFFERASHLARIGSGSAARSVFGGWVSWGETSLIRHSSDHYATPLHFDADPVFGRYRDSILIVSRGEKKVSSRAGHELMNDHPFAEARYQQAVKNLELLLQSLKTGDLELFVDVVENEALSLHAMMMASRPGYLLLMGNTISIMEKVRDFRKQTGSRVCFTLDAGPNVHLLYPETGQQIVEKFIEQELLPFCRDGKVIYDRMGTGPKKIGKK